MEDARTETTPAIGITLQYPLDEGVGRGLVFQTFVAADCETGELNGALDKVRKAADRQRAIVQLPTLRGLLADAEDALHTAVAAAFEGETARDMLNNRWSKEHAESGRRGSFSLSSAQVAERTKLDQQVLSNKANVEVLQRRIAIDKRKVADAEKLIEAGE